MKQDILFLFNYRMYFLIFIYILVCTECTEFIKQKYKISGLLPELKYFNDHNECFKENDVKWIDSLSSIHFAKQHFNNFFNSYYNCNILLDIRDSKVFFLILIHGKLFFLIIFFIIEVRCCVWYKIIF